jgi:hypothetical protein
MTNCKEKARISTVTPRNLLIRGKRRRRRRRRRRNSDLSQELVE